MRFVVAWLGLAVLLAGVATTADAKKPAKKHKQYAARTARPAPDQWYERDVNKLPFGSSLWWEQMLRENRLTCCN
jgi:hypothetical protein